jgi:hypothetical protein
MGTIKALAGSAEAGNDGHGPSTARRVDSVLGSALHSATTTIATAMPNWTDKNI